MENRGYLEAGGDHGVDMCVSRCVQLDIVGAGTEGGWAATRNDRRLQ